jgi:hypothetical protein
MGVEHEPADRHVGIAQTVEQPLQVVHQEVVGQHALFDVAPDLFVQLGNLACRVT